jgi:hypothetical protein
MFEHLPRIKYVRIALRLISELSDQRKNVLKHPIEIKKELFNILYNVIHWEKNGSACRYILWIVHSESSRNLHFQYYSTFPRTVNENYRNRKTKPLFYLAVKIKRLKLPAAIQFYWWLRYVWAGPHVTLFTTSGLITPTVDSQ